MGRQPSEYDQIFGSWLQRRRKALALTQAELAAALGCSTATVRKIEADERRPSEAVAIRLAELLEVEAQEVHEFIRFARGGWSERPVTTPSEQQRPWRLPWQRRHNLEDQLTSFVGREDELRETTTLLRRPETRLVTLTGPGGIGKTRLALEVARSLRDEFEDGVFAVRLAHIREPELVPAAMAQVLGVREAEARSPQLALKGHLEEQRLLLVLDNFEQVVTAAPLLVELLGDCPGLKLLVTSRERLRVRGEIDLPIQPLALPPSAGVEAGRFQKIAASAAVELFVRRAREVDRDFTLDEQNAEAIAEICRRLDGLPLALELAAARMRILTPATTLARLRSRLELLTGGPRDAPERQRTMRAAIDWSHDLLDEAEQRLFRRLAVFAGGFSLEAARAVCHMEEETLELVSSLVDKSLLRVSQAVDDEPRFAILHTIREYALERLVVSGEEPESRSRHAAFFLDLVERVEPQWRGPRQARWLERLSAEMDNFRAALDFSAGHAPERAVRMLGDLVRLWLGQGAASEFRARAEAVLPSAEVSAGPRAKLLAGLGHASVRQGDAVQAVAFFQEARELYARLGDLSGQSLVLAGLGHAMHFRGDLAAAKRHTLQALEVARTADSPLHAAYALVNLGEFERSLGNYRKADTYYREGLALAQGLDDALGMSTIQINLGYVALHLGDGTRAEVCFEEALRWAGELRDPGNLASALEGLAALAAARSDSRRAARLFAAASAINRAAEIVPDPADLEDIERYKERARSRCDAAEWNRAWQEGLLLTIDEAIALALDTPGAEHDTAASSQAVRPADEASKTAPPADTASGSRS